MECVAFRERFVFKVNRRNYEVLCFVIYLHGRKVYTSNLYSNFIGLDSVVDFTIYRITQ